ncbi:MAG: hypothetical protein HXY45_21155 [Syntrophaceae bacterium]|nr:hypothetical protein [Syntrophaceae bacterium]
MIGQDCFKERKKMRIQITLTSPEGKRIIAKGIKRLPEVHRVRKRGKLLLKGGTTVSAVSEELCGKPMRISGMITPQGTLTSRWKHEIPWSHACILRGNEVIPLHTREDWGREVPSFTPEDLVITGANAFDAQGRAAIMAATYDGGSSLPFFQTLLIEGVPFLVAVGLEKFVPGNLEEVIPLAGRRKVDLSYGAAVGLVPVFGGIFTEIEALESLAGVKARVIGKGGIHGAEGSTTFLVDGPPKEVIKIDKIYQSIKGSKLSGDPRNLIPCQRGSLSCKNHVGCLYKRPGHGKTAE